MRRRTMHFFSLILAFSMGIVGTLVTVKILFDNDKDKKTDNIQPIQQITISETNSIYKSIEKIYNATVVIEAYDKKRQIGSGTGFIYKIDEEKAYIITNSHVISNNEKLIITNTAGTKVEATVLGKDEYIDVAVLAIDKSTGLLSAEIGDSTVLKLGDPLFTVGTPIDTAYMGTVTKGILSGKDRAIEVDSASGTPFIMQVLQTDAAINPGNSGGPLVNLKGQVVGVNSLKLADEDIEGMGFAIPIEIVMGCVDRLEKGETIVRPQLGITLVDANNNYYLYNNKIYLDKEFDSGIAIVDVLKDSVAYKAGLKKADVILAINDVEIKGSAHFRFILYKFEVGDTIKIKYYRTGEEKEVLVKLTKGL